MIRPPIHDYAAEAARKLDDEAKRLKRIKDLKGAVEMLMSHEYRRYPRVYDSELDTPHPHL